MSQVRRATASWSGDLPSGSGTVSAHTSGVFSDLPTSWKARTESSDGMTSPDELLAAAHASCYSMSIANKLAQAGTPAEHIHVAAEVTADKREAGWTVLSSALQVIGRVPGISAGDFERIAAEAKDGCPISRAMVGNVEMTIDATLEEPEGG